MGGWIDKFNLFLWCSSKKYTLNNNNFRLICRSLLVLLSFFIRSLHYCMSFDLRIPITPLISSNSSNTTKGAAVDVMV